MLKLILLSSIYFIEVYTMSKFIHKILAIMSTLLILFVVLFSIIFSYLFIQHSQNVEKSRLESTALSLADSFGKTSTESLTNIYNNNVLQLIDTVNQAEIWLIDKNSLQISGCKINPNLTYNQLSSNSANEIQEIFSGKNITSTNFNDFTNSQNITIGVPVYSNGQIIGALLLHSQLPTLKFSWYDGIALMFFCSVLLFIVLIFLLYKLLKRYVIPLQVLNNFIDKMLQHNYNTRLKSTSNDEISLLAQKLNSLASHLQNVESSCQLKTQASSNIIIKTAYKLHTPIKNLKQNLKDFSNIYIHCNPTPIEEMHKNIDRISSITTNLLDLSELNCQEFKLQKDLLNIIEILKQSIESRQKFANEKQISLHLNINLAQNIILYTGDKNRLKQMFSETIDKALQLYPQNSDLNININEDDDNYYIYLQNTNNEITISDLPEMFQQFYKPEVDDSLLNSIELKIAHHLASLHHIKLTYEQINDNYTIFKFIIAK